MLMEEQLWEDEEADVKEYKKVVAAIFEGCDPEDSGKVCVDSLIAFMDSMAEEKLEQSTLEELRVILDPEGINLKVGKETLITAMKTWADNVQDNLTSKDDPPDSYDGSSTISICTSEPSSLRSSPSQTNIFSFDMLNVSSYSCGGSDIGPNVNEQNEVVRLNEQVKELTHVNKRLECQNKDLQSQLHGSEENYAQLLNNYQDVSRKMSSLQSSMDQNQQLQKEYEELKESLAVAEASCKSLKSQAQQLEKEVQKKIQHSAQLENQKVELEQELDTSIKKNDEAGKTMSLLQMELEEALKNLRLQIDKNDKLSIENIDLQMKNENLEVGIKHLQSEKQSVENRLLNMEDDLLSAQSQMSLSFTRRSSTLLFGESEDEIFVSARSSPLTFQVEVQNSLFSELEAAIGQSDEWRVEYSSPAFRPLLNGFERFGLENQSLCKFEEGELQRESQNRNLDFLQHEFEESTKDIERLQRESEGPKGSNYLSSTPRISRISFGSVEGDQLTFKKILQIKNKEVQCLWSKEYHNQESQTIGNGEGDSGQLITAMTQTEQDDPACSESGPSRKRLRTEASIVELRDQEVQCLWFSECRSQESQTLDNIGGGDSSGQLISIMTQTEPGSPGPAGCGPSRKRVRIDTHTVEESSPRSRKRDSPQLYRPMTALFLWVEETDRLIAARRKTNLQVRPGGVFDIATMDQQPLEADVTSTTLKRATSVGVDQNTPVCVTSTQEDDEAASSTLMRRCASESQVLSVEGSGSSLSSDASSNCTTPEVFPSLPDVMLQQLGLSTPVKASDVLTDQDIENRFSMLSLAFKTDKLTLTSRHDRQQRQRDQSERNMAAEVTKLKAAVHNLNYLCKDSESIEILGKIQDQVDVLLRSTERVSSSAEIYGAVQQESRVSKAIEVMLAHVENLKRMYEKAHAELEETKRVLLENNLVVEGTTVDGGRRDSRHRILTTTVSGQGKQRRRASIAVFRPMGSPESAKSANSPLTFGESKNHVLRGGVHSRRSASIHLENLSSGWDHIDRPDMVVGSSMDDIKELSEGRRDSGADLEDQSSNLEENNNCTVSSASRKSSRCDSPMDVRRESTGVDTDRSPLWTSDMTEEYNRCCNCTATTVSSVNSIRSYRESAMEFICQTHAALLDCIVPLNMDYVLIQTRRFITFVLLFAAFWSIVSVFVPTSAEAGSCTPISWLTIDEILRPFLQLRHHGQPPT